MAVAKARRLWRRTMANSRFAYYQYFTRRTTRLMRRGFIFTILIVVIFAFYDFRGPEYQRYVYSDVIRQSLGHRMGPTSTDPRTWPTWRGINTIFVFGDSNSDTGFNPNGPQPDLENPLGNPAWPGRTASYGANFIGHMTATFNQSFIRTFNFASRLAPVKSRTEKLHSLPLGEQIEKKFIKRYGPSSKMTSRSTKGTGSWSQIESLFVIYIGVDDLLHTTVDRRGGRNNTTIKTNIEAYEESMQTLYEAGARNFLLVNFPQLEEAPFMRSSGILNYVWDFGAEIVQYNGRLAFMAHRFAESRPDSNVFVFDNHKLSLAIRQEPTQFPETSRYTHLNGFCYPYVHDIWWTDTHQVFDQQCGVALDGWYWRDDTHVTEPYHRLMARQIVALLNDPRQRLPLEFY